MCIIASCRERSSGKDSRKQNSEIVQPGENDEYFFILQNNNKPHKEMDKYEKLIELNMKLQRLNEELHKIHKDAQNELEEKRKEAKDLSLELESAKTQLEHKARELDAAESLSTPIYQELITKLFGKPTEEILDSIEKRAKQARFLTAGIAIISIIATLVFSMFIRGYQMDKVHKDLAVLDSLILESQSKLLGIDTSASKTLSIVEEIDETTNSISETTDEIKDKTEKIHDHTQKTKGTVAKIKTVVDKSLEGISTIFENAEAKEVAEYFDSTSKDFSNFESVNDVGLAYKFRIVKHYSKTKHSTILKGMEFSKSIKRSIRVSDDQLRRWSYEMIDLCQNAINYIEENKDLKGNVVEEDLFCNKFMSSTDETDYRSWQYLDKSATYQDLLNFYKSLLDKHKAHKSLQN
ncbi:hypothetical protein JYU16_01155 [bacterium AH-315-M05]|nr:hypothetical protein [bacterium AH-315-M05]